MRRFDIDFSELHRLAEQMGAMRAEYSVTMSHKPLEPIDIELAEGIEIPLNEVEFGTGLLEYKGRQILLYIKDHSYGTKFQEAVENGSRGMKFHVADCQMLQRMRERNRYNRYHVTNNLSGEFSISGKDPLTHEVITGSANLNVCRYCLDKLNYQGFTNSGGSPKSQIVNSFSIYEFFSKYSSFFKHMPRSRASDSGGYTSDWKRISTAYREQKNYICEDCGVGLSEHRNILHAHHKDGVKSNNEKDNLVALCADCHRKQDSHDHMFVNLKTMRLLTRIRREQSIGIDADWSTIIELADPAVEGTLLQCQASNLPAPEIGVDVLSNNGEVVANLEVAWPDRKVGISIDANDKVIATNNGWKVLDSIQVISNIASLKASLMLH